MLKGKEQHLNSLLQECKGLVVAYSGGVDSSLLLYMASQVLGLKKVLAVTADTPSLARTELDEIKRNCRLWEVELKVLQTHEFQSPKYLANAGDRCYWCKSSLFELASPIAKQRDWVLCYGENASDNPADRPGSRSADEWQVRAPLREADFSKADVRELARQHGLSMAEKPAMPCLSSRIPVGVPVTIEALGRVELFESKIRQLGFQILRARDRGFEKVSLEVGREELALAESSIHELTKLARDCGYQDLALAVYNS